MPSERAELNLYEFYREVGLRFEREVLGNVRMTSTRNDHLHDVLGELQDAYHKAEPIDYSDPDRIVAYTFSFAPKHALIWRELAKKFTYEEDDDPGWRLNSIGPGPGSDLIGLLCGLSNADDVDVSVVGLESEDAWRQMFEFVREEFIERTGIYFDALMTNRPSNLHADGQTIGSFVLSDAARSGTLRGLLDGIKTHTSGDVAWFLDFPSYTCPTNGKTYINKPVQDRGFKCTWEYLPDLNLGIKEAIAAQMDVCDPIYCKRIIREEPKVNFLKVRLR